MNIQISIKAGVGSHRIREQHSAIPRLLNIARISIVWNREKIYVCISFEEKYWKEITGKSSGPSLQVPASDAWLLPFTPKFSCIRKGQFKKSPCKSQAKPLEFIIHGWDEWQVISSFPTLNFPQYSDILVCRKFTANSFREHE